MGSACFACLPHCEINVSYTLRSLRLETIVAVGRPKTSLAQGVWLVIFVYETRTCSLHAVEKDSLSLVNRNIHLFVQPTPLPEKQVLQESFLHIPDQFPFSLSTGNVLVKERKGDRILLKSEPSKRDRSMTLPIYHPEESGCIYQSVYHF
jgi:hypothetical protein